MLFRSASIDYMINNKLLDTDDKDYYKFKDFEYKLKIVKNALSIVKNSVNLTASDLPEKMKEKIDYFMNLYDAVDGLSSALVNVVDARLLTAYADNYDYVKGFMDDFAIKELSVINRLYSSFLAIGVQNTTISSELKERTKPRISSFSINSQEINLGSDRKSVV